MLLNIIIQLVALLLINNIARSMAGPISPAPSMVPILLFVGGNKNVIVSCRLLYFPLVVQFHEEKLNFKLLYLIKINIKCIGIIYSSTQGWLGGWGCTPCHAYLFQILIGTHAHAHAQVYMYICIIYNLLNLIMFGLSEKNGWSIVLSGKYQIQYLQSMVPRIIIQGLANALLSCRLLEFYSHNTYHIKYKCLLSTTTSTNLPKFIIMGLKTNTPLTPSPCP